MHGQPHIRFVIVVPICLCVVHNFTSIQYFLVRCKFDKFHVHRLYADTETVYTISVSITRVIYTYEVPSFGQL